MRLDRKYVVAVALLAVLAVAFGFAGASAPMSEQISIEQSSSSSSDSVTRFLNPPTYDSDWMNITDMCGQYFTLVHNLSSMDVTVDITGRTVNLTEENWHQFWSMGDVNRDGYIDDADGDLIIAAFGSYPGHPNWNPDADLNQDLAVDILDAGIFASNYGLDIWTYFGAGVHQRNLGGTGYTPGWWRTYGRDSDSAKSVAVQTDDGGYAIAGWTGEVNGPPRRICWLIKTGPSGNMQWNQTYGGNRSFIESLIQTNDGGFAMAGSTPGADGWDFWLVKTDSSGYMELNKTYGGTNTDRANSVVQASDDGYALAGYTNSFGGDFDFWLVKVDSSGNHDWNQTYGDAGDDSGRSVVRTGDGGYAIAGNGFANLVKTDINGSILWNETYGGYPYSVIQTYDSGYALAGYKEGDFWLVKTDASGNMQWNKTYGGARPGNDQGYSVVQTRDRGYAIAGSTPGARLLDSDFWLVKTDSSGNIQWDRTYDGGDYDVATSVIQMSDGGYVMAGLNTLADFWLVKTCVESGLAWADSTPNSITLYRGATDPYWNYVRVRIWVIEEPTWMFGDINQDGVVDAKDLAIIGQNYGKTFSALSLGGIIAIAGIYTYKKRKQPK